MLKMTDRITRWWNNTPLMISRQRKLDWQKTRQAEIGMKHILDFMAEKEFKQSVVKRMRKKFDIPNFTVDEETKAYDTMVTELSKEVMCRYATSH